MHSCVHCGTCNEACQFFLATGDPKMTPVYKVEVLRKLYKRQYDWMGKLFPAWVGSEEPTEELLAELYDVAWGSCTMCRRCTFRCPMGVATALLIRTTALLIRTARSMLQACGQVPKELQDTVDMHLRAGNNIMFYPLLLLAQAKIFHAAHAGWTLSSNVWDATNYALFNGDDTAAKEICHRFFSNAERLKISTVLMTECGHGYRVMRFEASNWLGRRVPVEVKSFNEVVADWVKQGRIRLDPSRNKEPVTYHDPCNQARSGGIVNEPRYLLRHAVEDFREMSPSGVDNICCGGGGGALTMSEFRSRRLEAGRVMVGLRG